MAQANQAFYYVTGPVHVFVRFPRKGLGPEVAPQQLSGQTLFLGHCEESPEPDFVPKYVPVHSALSGPEVPDDEIQMGGEYKLELKLSRFDLSLVNTIKQFARYGRGLPAGSESFLDRGRLIQAHGDSFEIWCQNAFFGTPNAAAYPNLTPGYYYPAVRSEGVLPRKLSRDAKTVLLQLKPISVRQGVTGDTITYSEDPIFFRNLPDPG